MLVRSGTERGRMVTIKKVARIFWILSLPLFLGIHYVSARSAPLSRQGDEGAGNTAGGQAVQQTTDLALSMKPGFIIAPVLRRIKNISDPVPANGPYTIITNPALRHLALPEATPLVVRVENDPWPGGIVLSAQAEGLVSKSTGSSNPQQWKDRVSLPLHVKALGQNQYAVVLPRPQLPYKGMWVIWLSARPVQPWGEAERQTYGSYDAFVRLHPNGKFVGHVYQDGKGILRVVPSRMYSPGLAAHKREIEAALQAKGTF